MELTRSLYRNSVFLYSAFAILVLLGFWNSYYSNPFQVSKFLVHIHGFAMTVWCAMIVGQGYLIRANHRALHRIIGKTSYIVAPTVFVLMIAVTLAGVPTIPSLFQDGAITDRGYFLMSITLNGAIIFALLYGLAILNRRNPAVHSRLMICTIFPIAAAAVSRVFHNYAPALDERMPVIAGEPTPQVVAWVLADVILLVLAAWDWRSHRRVNVFPPVLALLLVYHLFTANAHRIVVWRAFSDWALGV